MYCCIQSSHEIITFLQSHQLEWQPSPRGAHKAVRKMTSLILTLLLSYCGDKMDKTVRKVEMVVTGCQAHLDPLVHQAVEGWSTLAGDERSALAH